MKIFNSIKITFLLFALFYADNICAQNRARMDFQIDTLMPEEPHKPISSLDDEVKHPNADYSVGSFKGSFTVGDMGNATYSVPIAVPNGGGFEPQLSVCYNSFSSGYGLFGSSFDLSGLPVIIREGSNQFMDGKVKGVTYSSEDNFVLEGKRLVLKSGENGFDGAEYSVYGDPYTTVTLRATDGNTNIWFEVKTQDGTVYQYGKDVSSRLAFTNKKGIYHISSWYINKAVDKYGNTITYNYTASGYKLYPTSIVYGKNSNKDRGITNKVVFEYKNLSKDSKRLFAIEDRQGVIDRCVSSITTYTNSSVYRRYDFTYEDYGNFSDNTCCLKSICKKNGNEEKFKPIIFNWNFKQSSLEKVSIDFETQDAVMSFEGEIISDKSFQTMDLNADGYSDIIMSYVMRLHDGGSYLFLDYNLSKVDSNGKVSYEQSHTLPARIPATLGSSDDFKLNVNGYSSADFDGDGIQDLTVQVYYKNNHTNNNASWFFVMLGKEMLDGKLTGPYMNVVTHASDDAPLFVFTDVDKNGISEILCVEKKYNGTVYKGEFLYFDYKSGAHIFNRKEFGFSFPEELKKLYYGDYNNDGLNDLLFLYNGGYKIYFCNGGGNSLLEYFSEENVKEGTSIRDFWRIEQGDFDGDGLLDFVYYDSNDDYKLTVSRNNGDGSFSVMSSISLDLNEKNTCKDNDKFAIRVADFDGDGKSDVFVCKAHYEYHGGLFNSGYEHDYTRIYWLYSDGKNLNIIKDYKKYREEDALEHDIFLGDFDGDGSLEIANYGTPLNSESTYYDGGKFNYYKFVPYTASYGKVVDIHDGIDDKVYVNYKYGTNPSVYSITANRNKNQEWIYTKLLNYEYRNNSNGYGSSISTPISEEDTPIHRSYDDIQNPYEHTGSVDGTKSELISEYPINVFTLPIPLVSCVTITNGCIGQNVMEYSYEDLICHVNGRGVLGFNAIMNDDVKTGKKSVTRIVDWNKNYLIPIETKTENILDGKSSYSVSKTRVCEMEKNFFAYVYNQKSQDFDGNVVVTKTNYDESIGVILNKTIENDGDDMYKKVVYEYNDLQNPILPTSIIKSQKYIGCKDVYKQCVAYSYDASGNVIHEVENYGMDLALTTTRTFDNYGNVLSSVVIGKGVKPITVFNEYDKSGRFVTKMYQNPAGAINTYKYDNWGNVTEASDETDSSNILTTTYEYDGWGRNIGTKTPLGIVKEFNYKWGELYELRKMFYVQETEAKYTYMKGNGVIKTDTIYNSPWVKTWYDAAGRETEQETIGLNDTPITHSTYYDDLGRKEKIENKTGILTTSEIFTYDKFNRVVKDELSTGKTITYTYETSDDGIKTILTNEDGKETVRSYDLWGNLVHVVDAINGTIDYYYKSNGKPSEIHSNGSIVSMKYDECGNQISLTDPDAGTMTYTYAADGTVLKQTDGRGVETVNTYDNLGRVSSTQIGNTIITNTYGTVGTGKLRLVRQSIDGNSFDYTYDKFGRVITETKTVKGQESLVYGYTYNNMEQLSGTEYPGGLVVSYEYDKYGNKIKTIADGKVICEHLNYDGKEASLLFLGKMTSLTTLDDNGFPSCLRIKKGSVEKEGLDVEFDPLTGNLLSSKRFGSYYEQFYGYDELDRLESVRESAYGRDKEVLRMDYDNNGNIYSKSDIGRYEYNEDFKPHAVIEVENSNVVLPLSTLDIVYNSFGKVQTINDEKTTYSLSVEYGPDMERCYTALSKNGKVVKTILFGGDYEKVVENGVTREFYYLDGNTIVVKKDGKFTPYLAMTDHLDSYLAVVDSLGKKVYSASYDTWGKQSVSVNTIGFHRGYTGHEMLNEFQLINMNGRLYDPVLGRFLSCDNYVQMPDNTQNFNRYSYCLNNPLKYNDPSGELFGIDDVLLFSIFSSAVMGAMQADMNGQNAWKGALIGAGSALATYGVGQAFGAVGSFGHEALRAGAHGLSGALSGGISSSFYGGSFDDGFWKGFVNGVISSGTGSITDGMNKISQIGLTTLSGGVSALITGDDFLQGAFSGFQVGTLNFAEGNDSKKTYYPNSVHNLSQVEVVANAPLICPKDVVPITRIAYIATMMTKTCSKGYLYMYSGKDLVFKCPAVSGSPSSYTIPDGNYEVNKCWNRTEAEFTRHGVGYTASLENDPFYDNWAKRNRYYIRIHPCRGSYTNGCIGLLTDNVSALKMARSLMTTSLQNGNISLSVNLFGR